MRGPRQDRSLQLNRQEIRTFFVGAGKADYRERQLLLFFMLDYLQFQDVLMILHFGFQQLCSIKEFSNFHARYTR